MSILLAAATVLATTMSGTTDTTFSVASGTRLELENFGGSISVTAWDKNSIRLEAEHGARTEIAIEREGQVIQVEARHSRGVPTGVDYEIHVPVWMPLKLSGTYSDISVQGTRARIQAETVKGDITVKGGAELVSLSSVEGEVSVTGSSGRVEISSTNDDVRAQGVSGDLTVDAVNGSVWLYGSKSASVEASTVNGDIVYDGELRPDGRYEFSTHNGDIGVAVPEKSNVTVSVATFSGDFESAFPITLSETRKGKRFKFTLGNGGANVDLESFQGTIYVVRPGAAILKEGAHDHDEWKVDSEDWKTEKQKKHKKQDIGDEE